MMIDDFEDGLTDLAVDSGTFTVAIYHTGRGLSGFFRGTWENAVWLDSGPAGDHPIKYHISISKFNNTK